MYFVSYQAVNIYFNYQMSLQLYKFIQLSTH